MFNLLANPLALRKFQGLLGPIGLMSANRLEQEAALRSLSTLMTITPMDTYREFKKHLRNSQDRHAHDLLSRNDIQGLCLGLIVALFLQALFLWIYTRYLDWEKENRPSSGFNSPYFTTNSGAPVWNNNSSLTIGTRAKVTKLVELGFGREAVVQALKFFDGNEEAAAGYLFGG